MTVATVSQVRHAIATRLQTLAAPLRVYETLPEAVTLPRVAIVYPARNPSGLWHDSFNEGVLSYRYVVELWIDTQAGSESAQDILDAYIAPTGTSSIQVCLESRATSDNLLTYTTSVRVDQFLNYGFGALHGQEGLLTATIPVWCLIDGTA